MSDQQTASLASPIRDPVIDMLKVIGSQTIALHHCTLYGPLAHDALSAAPFFLGFFHVYGRCAAQFFLLMGGYNATKHLSTHNRHSTLWHTILTRYKNIMPAYLIALMTIIAIATITRAYCVMDFLGPQENFQQLISHMLLVQHILDIPSISAGVWYISIDMQLFVLSALCMKICRNTQYFLYAVTLSIVSSLSYFSYLPQYDMYAWYFFASYGLGILIYYSIHKNHIMTIHYMYLIIACTYVISNYYNFSTKNVFLLIASCIFYLLLHYRFPIPAITTRSLQWLSQRSYHLFLTHYGMIIIVNALYFYFINTYLASYSLWFIGLLWISSIAFAHYMYIVCEKTSEYWGRIYSHEKILPIYLGIFLTKTVQKVNVLCSLLITITGFHRLSKKTFEGKNIILHNDGEM